MTELQKTLKQLENTLGRLQVSGPATIIMGDAYRLLFKAQSLSEPKEEQKDA